MASWAGLALLVGVVALSRWSDPQPPAPENQPVRLEVAATNLSLHDGRLWLNHAGKPYSGWMLEWYADGALRSRSEISNGVLHGWSEGWHTNGQLQVREPFFEGVSDGVRTKWYASGAKLSEAGIVRGNLEGAFRRWHENGQLSEETEFRGGNPTGLGRAWYASGCLKSEVVIRNGVTVERRTWRDGESPPQADSPPGTVGGTQPSRVKDPTIPAPKPLPSGCVVQDARLIAEQFTAIRARGR